MIDLLNLSWPEFEAFIVGLGEPRFRALQVWQWIWQRNVTDFECMTNVAKSTRAKLAENAVCIVPQIVTAQKSEDGTEKLLLQMTDGALVETVIIPSEDHASRIRISQCVSSQIGCPMGCTFCSTGGMGFVRNMTAGEILSQVLIAKRRIGDNRPDLPIIRNLVFMGMGEPLLNATELHRALETLHHDKGLGFSARRITVSTCGIKSGLKEFGNSELAFLAVSLHAPNQALRERIMPRASLWHLDDMMQCLAEYPLMTRERVTFEYLLLGGINDQPEHAKELARLLCKTLGPERAKINLIAYNPSYTPNSDKAPYRAPTPEAILTFEKILWDKRITAVLRKSKGRDIKAACGQLCAEHQKNINPNLT